MNTWEMTLVSKLDCIADFDLEVSHKLDLLIIPVTEFAVSIINWFSIFEKLTIFVLKWTSKQEQGTNIVDFDIVLSNVLIEEHFKIGPNRWILSGTLESVIKLVLSNIFQVVGS